MTGLVGAGVLLPQGSAHAAEVCVGRCAADAAKTKPKGPKKEVGPQRPSPSPSAPVLLTPPSSPPAAPAVPTAVPSRAPATPVAPAPRVTAPTAPSPSLPIPVPVAPVPVPARTSEPPSARPVSPLPIRPVSPVPARPVSPVPISSPSAAPEQRSLSIAVVTAQTREDAARDVLAEASTPAERVQAQVAVASATQAVQEAEAALADESTSPPATRPVSVPPASGAPTTGPTATGPTPAALAAPAPVESPDRATRAASSVSDAGAGRGQLAALIAGIAVLLVIIVRELAR